MMFFFLVYFTEDSTCSRNFEYILSETEYRKYSTRSANFTKDWLSKVVSFFFAASNKARDEKGPQFIVVELFF